MVYPMQPFRVSRVVAGRRPAVIAPHMQQYDDGQDAPMMSTGPSTNAAAGAPEVSMVPGYNSVNRQRPILSAVRANAEHALGQADFASMAPIATAGPSHHRDGSIIPGSQEHNQQSNEAGRYSFIQHQQRVGNQLMASQVGSNTYSQDQRTADLLPGMVQAQTGLVNAQAEGTRAQAQNGGQDYKALYQQHQDLQRAHQQTSTERDNLLKQITALQQQISKQTAPPAKETVTGMGQGEAQLITGIPEKRDPMGNVLSPGIPPAMSPEGVQALRRGKYGDPSTRPSGGTTDAQMDSTPHRDTDPGFSLRPGPGGKMYQKHSDGLWYPKE